MDVILGKGDSMRSSRFVALLGLVLLTSFQAVAVPTAVTFANPTNILGQDVCDSFDVANIPGTLDEIGTAAGGFPAGEQLTPVSLAVASPATVGPAGHTCNSPALQDSPFRANFVLGIRNDNPVDYTEVWYVANTANGTDFSNWDGTINGNIAYRIDNVGLNKPLVSESLIADGIWNAGETWVFTLQDWSNANLLNGLAINAVGVPGLLGDGSSGSILALVAPEPGTAGLLIVGLLGLARFARKSA
jgi:hypothetical protein